MRKIGVSLLILILSIGAGWTRQAMSGAIAPDEQITLSGWFVTIWPDAPEGEQSPRFFLIDKTGRWTELEVGDAIKGLRSFDRKQVTVEGFYEEPLAAIGTLAPQARSTEQKFRVRSILPDKESFAPMATEMTAQAAITGSKPWATLLCRFADSTGTTPREWSWFDGLMAGSDYPSMNHFWGEVSYWQTDFVGSRVFGWYNLPHPKSHYVSDTNGDGVEDADLGRLADDCAAAADAEVYFPQYAGVDFVFNQTIGCCAWGGGIWLTRDNQSGQSYGATWLPPWALTQTTIAHERGHGAFGFPHSSGPYNTAYDSRWDPMSGSFFNCGSPYGCVSAHTIAFHKAGLAGWIPPEWIYTAASGSSATVEIERLAQPAGAGYLMAKIPIAGSATEFYTVEARKRAGYDDPLPDDVVLIHHVDTTRLDRLAQVVDVDNNGDPNDAAAMWVPGETFADVNGISVSVVSATANGFLVTITNGSVPTQFTLAVSKSGNGTIAAPGISCGSDCQESFSDGTVVALSASPDAGWTFSGWSGDADCGDGQVAMSHDMACTAIFIEVPAPDLVGQFVSLSNKVKSGLGKVSVKVSVTNVGDMTAQTADKRMYVALYLSSDAVLDGSDLYLKTVSAKAKKGLAQWQSVTVKGNVTLPEPGNGKFLIAVVDPWGQISESDENNNFAVTSIP